MNILYWIYSNFLLFSAIWFISIAITHILFAYAVYLDADARKFEEKKLVFVPVLAWTFATLLGGIFTAAIYWLIHHSTLNPENLKDKNESIL